MLEPITSFATHFSLVTNRKLPNGKKKIPRIIKCCSSKRNNGKRISYYQVLGVSTDSGRKEIKEAYRRLQKQHHPDIAGEKGHEYTLLLNEAYKELIRGKQSRSSINKSGASDLFDGMGYSSWNGPVRDRALFVDENKCIGCRECVHHASNTFTMDEAVGCARVHLQFGDHDKQIEVAMESCPVNCIHWVENEDLPFLEFVMQPQPKEAFGVFGGGWERPINVFHAAMYLKKQHGNQRDFKTNWDEEMTSSETPSQAKARREASDQNLQLNQFQKVWSWFTDFLARE